MFAENFLYSFFEGTSDTYISENDRTFEYKFTAIQYLSPDSKIVASYFNFLQASDQLTFTIEFGEGSPVTFYSASPDFVDFEARLENEYSFQENEPIIVTFKIDKQNTENTISIYDLEVFTKTIEKLTISQSFVIFSRILSTKSFINFNVLNLDTSFNTASLFFVNPKSSISVQEFQDRKKRIENILTVSNFTNIKEHNLTPDDFKFQIENDKYSDLCKLFSHYSSVLSILYLFDITTLNENQLEFKINGYKSIKGTIDASAIVKSEEDYYTIYNWVYSGGNLNDKIGLARNIISLHLIENGKIELKGNPFQSIQSSYKVYEKQNIKQYIEIRNKISDQLLDFNNRANKVIETFANGFQKSALALISFYISVIVIRVLSKGDFVNVFSLDSTILSISFISISFIYYRMAKWEVLEQKKRFQDSYLNLKDRYTDLLNKDDIERILNSDKEFEADVKFIDDKLKRYSKLWIYFLIILLSTTVFLFSIYNLSTLLDTNLGHFFFEKSCDC